MLDAYPASGPEGGAACRLPTQAGRELRVGAVSRPRQGAAPPRGWLGPTREHVPQGPRCYPAEERGPGFKLPLALQAGNM